MKSATGNCIMGQSGPWSSWESAGAGDTREDLSWFVHYSFKKTKPQLQQELFFFFSFQKLPSQHFPALILDVRQILHGSTGEKVKW